ncbi:MAG TPA: hypothetical protein ENJ10_10555 [Caldithrix abyssi]|uniref:Uncharacterized protein n=1 Tax=Caldithrix abyssi TaxID=187145 RepID=A0A7V1LNA0_CALAY|nr:hypothetical protein [Caldithrix abyssi]
MRLLLIFTLAAVLTLSSCVGKRELIADNPYSQASVVIHLKDGTKKQGIVLKKQDNNLVYVDAASHNKETIPFSQIKTLTESAEIYDFEGYPIPSNEIAAQKGMNNTLLYGGAGFVLGAAAGAGVGVGLVASDVELNPLISIGVFGIGSAVYFGLKGNEVDYEDASFDVRKNRYQKSKAKRDKAIEEAKRKLEEQERKKQELLKKIEEKKKKH